MCLLNSWNVASATEELNFKVEFILIQFSGYTQLVSTILDCSKFPHPDIFALQMAPNLDTQL